MPISPQEALQRTIEHREIFPDEMLSIMRRIMGGELTPVMIAALTVGLRVKKETIGEIAAAARSDARVRDQGRRARSRSSRRHRRHRRRRVAHVQHLDRGDVRRRRGRRARRQAWRTLGVVEIRQRRRARGARRQHHAHACAGRPVDRGDRHRLHVRAVAPQRDEARRPGAQGARRADDLQHPRARSPIRRARRTSCSACSTPIWSASRCACCSGSAAGTCWSSTARTAWTRCRSARRRWSASSRTARCANTKSIPRTSACR